MNATPKPPLPIPQHVLERTRDWAWHEFAFGEWQRTADIAKFIRDEFGYTGDTPNQYAARFINIGVANRDFEKRVNGRQWRWIVHPAKDAP